MARIAAVADSFDAMSSKRVYRDSLPKEVVRDEIMKNLGTQFDPLHRPLRAGQPEHLPACRQQPSGNGQADSSGCPCDNRCFS